ncbi:sulfatase [Galbibacter sp.]|uniref:sulfatase n=1 Tax=Galbibacter sp. TaxID=2918471 RepID=UPI003A9144AA
MKKIFILYFFLSLTPFYSQKQPNIIVFIVDDMGWMDTSVPFTDTAYPLNKQFHTPNMERLAKTGTKFTNAYATPICTPSRVSLLTGMNAAHHKVTNWTMPHRDRNSDQSDEQFEAAEWNINGLNPSGDVPRSVQANPLPELLKNEGYYTIHAGKAHFAPNGTPGSNPENLGFMINIAGTGAGRPLSYLGQENYGNIDGKAHNVHAVPGMTEYFGSDLYLTEALTQRALNSLKTPIHRKEPFFLYLSHFAVHDPYEADERYLQKYLDAGLERVEAIYASMIEGMDKSLGDIMDFLEENEIEENTILLFISDNGGLSMAPPRGGTENTQNFPLRAGKGSVYEGGIRVPMIVKWNGVTEPSSDYHQPVIIEDFFPSILQMASIKPSNIIQSVDGKSFIPLLKKPQLKKEDRLLIWHIPNKWIAKDNLGINYRSAIRKGEWKMIYNMRDGSNELYNLTTDIGEREDLSSKYPDRVKELSILLSERLRKWKSPMPIIKLSGVEAPMPDEVYKN